ncbi:polyprenyl synthetase family protein [Edaphocola flava]|jgi:geranylgeranyl diphosphate synthase type II|uniref:polyprenyl synthetase family protein n=1 Tax=Edaphocola flava TaxID=2499629 RepID=UPI001F26BCBB|nr:polyprenyl synthetase family protein [Edaphocola flava]
MMQSFQHHAQAFEQFLQEQQLFSREPRNLYEPCSYILSIGGKRIRPSVCLMAAALYKGITPDVYWGAAAIELFHNFTLIHDDIMDNAPLRRGKTTVHELYSTTTAILSGDVMNIMAFQCLERVKPELIPVLLGIFNRTAIEVCEGQQLDMDFEQQDNVTEEAYIHMIAQKTAVLLACSMQIGALIAGATEEDAARLYTFGKNLGIAFQLQDDYLDTFGDGDKVGKQIGGDIQANKKTFLAITAMLQASDTQKTAINILAHGHGTTKVQDTIQLYNTLSVGSICKQAIDAYTQKALQALNEVQVPDEKKAPFRELVQFLINRDY